MQHLLQAFLPKQHLMIIWLNRAMTVLCQGFCYIKVIRIYIEIWIIYNNFATEITRLQQNMVALKNLASSENLAPPAPLRIQLQPNSKALLRFWNVASKARFFQPPHPPLPTCQGEEGRTFYAVISCHNAFCRRCCKRPTSPLLINKILSCTWFRVQLKVITSACILFTFSRKIRNNYKLVKNGTTNINYEVTAQKIKNWIHFTNPNTNNYKA